MEEAKVQDAADLAADEVRQSVKESLKTAEIELCLGKQLASSFMRSHNELTQRVSKMRRHFAKQYGFIVPEIKLTDDLGIPPKSYQIKISRHGRRRRRIAPRRGAGGDRRGAAPGCSR